MKRGGNIKCKVCGMKTPREIEYQDTNGKCYDDMCCEPCEGKYGKKIDIAMSMGTYGKKKVIVGLW